jgi:hypothetical protein
MGIGCGGSAAKDTDKPIMHTLPITRAVIFFHFFIM